MGVQERKAREKEELRQEILDAARELFVEHGYEAVSMRRIADRIEYSPTTIYLYFRDKADLFDCLCAETLELLVQRLSSHTEEAKNGSDPVSALRAGMRAYVDFGLQNPSHYRVTFMTPHEFHCQGGVATRSDATGERAFNCLVEAVQACATSGRIATPDPLSSAQMLWSGVHGLTSLLITHPNFPWVEREPLIDHLIDTLAKGLQP
jgi:AcrR family transcriptional regulator